VDLWRQGWGLAKDYFFTGSGLGTFWMVHALYSILLHVPFIAHTHNTFLEVWIEQGVLGALALLWGSVVLFTWYWRALDRRSLPLLGVAGLFGLASMFIHGIIDVVFYIERTLPLVGFALGYAWLAVPNNEIDQAARSRTRQASRILVLAGCVVLIFCLILFRDSFFSRFYANLGSLLQTRAELSVYDPTNYEKVSVDQTRQNIDYSRITEQFERSLSFDPANQTALQRLSLIALSRGEYAAAWEAMQVAWEANQRDITTQLLYADAAIANGFPEKAATALRANPWAEMHLMGTAWSRYWTHKDFQRALYSYQAVLLLNPANAEAQKRVAEAREKLGP
jgi:tetratricopeptide (TPR) repeat protein